jgi:hypothetical protein
MSTRVSRLALIGAFFCASLSHGAERVALVIGNNKYANLSENRQLTSPVADATDVAAALKALGYTLISGGAVTDASKDTMLNATEAFAKAAKNAEGAVFYYSGHGVQVGEDNYLLPSDAPHLTGISVLRNRTVLLRDSVMVALEESGAKNKVIILDCCRDNPFAAQLDTAMSQVGKSVSTKSVGQISGYGSGFYLAFATSPGTTADDGNGQRNSPFTSAMLKSFPTSAGKDIDFFFRDVKKLLGVEQVSWTNHSLNDSFALALAGMEKSLPPAPAVESVPTAPAPSPTALPPSNPPVPVNRPTLPERGYFDSREVFRGTTYEDYNAHSRSKLLRRAQTRLKEAGHYSGSVDGGMGPGTQEAILDWQENSGLEVTGRLDQKTQESLELLHIAESSPPRPVVPALQAPMPRHSKVPPAPTPVPSKKTGKATSSKL